jgi:uncharacterized protein (DUF433 family)
MPKFVKKATMLERITINAEQCGGKPCIRGMRIRVTDVLELLANGLTQEQVVEELEIELEDVQACLHYAVIKLNHPVLIAA